MDKTIFKESYQKVSGHLCYLSEALVALAFFDNSVPIEEKSRMLLAMNTVYGDEEPTKRIKIASKTPHEKDLFIPCFTKTP